MTKRHLWKVTFFYGAGSMMVHFIFHKPTHEEVLEAFKIEGFPNRLTAGRILAGDYSIEAVACYEVLRGR